MNGKTRSTQWFLVMRSSAALFRSAAKWTNLKKATLPVLAASSIRAASVNHANKASSNAVSFIVHKHITAPKWIVTTPTRGGYSTNIVVKQDYVLKVASDENLAAVAPLLCAGITTYSPIRRFKFAGPGQKVGVVGLGGLGHMAVKFAASMGAEVTVFSTSPSKEQDAKDLGAHHFVVTKDPQI